MAIDLSDHELTALDEAFDRALAGHEGELTILGYGEISAVVAWPTSGGEVLACRRMPPFSDEDGLIAYLVTVEEYLEALESQGVRPVETVVRWRRRGDGSSVAYVLQPAQPAESLLPRQLAEADQGRAAALFSAVLQQLRSCVDHRLGLDARASSWVVLEGDELGFLEVSTPLMRDEAGRERLDQERFLAALPGVLRPLARRTMMDELLERYYDPRRAVLHILSDLLEHGLASLVEPLLRQANGWVTPPLTEAEVLRSRQSDATRRQVFGRLRRLDRFWQRSVCRRQYPFLLPERIEGDV